MSTEEKPKHITHRGIYWYRDSQPATVKILLHEWTLRSLTKRGVDFLELQQFQEQFERGDKSHGSGYDRMPKGFRGEPNISNFVDYIEHMVPDFREYFNIHGTGHAYGFGRALTDRAYHSIVKDEMERFREPVWTPFRDMVINAMNNERPIEPVHRYTAHEKLVLQQTFDKSGVYLNQSCEAPEWFYLGTSSSISRRNGGHRNGNMFLVRAYPTGTGVIAEQLEQMLHERVVRTGLIKSVRNPDRPIGKQGAYQLEKGCDPIAIIDSIVNLDYREFCRGTVGIQL